MKTFIDALCLIFGIWFAVTGGALLAFAAAILLGQFLLWMPVLDGEGGIMFFLLAFGLPLLAIGIGLLKRRSD
jgi:hypothetical protein